MEKAVEFHDGTKPRGTVVENIAPKVEQARVAAEEEHQLSVWDALTKNKIVVFWCVFFAFSAVGWYVTLTKNPGPLDLRNAAGDLMHRSTVP